jgi:hypothetical protein
MNTDDFDVYLEGDIVSENFSKLMIDFYECKNKTDEEIKIMKKQG